MARISIESPRVQRMVSEILVPLYLQTGSIAAVCKTMNDRLREAGTGGVIHPNRIHAMMTDEPGKGLNEATVDLVEQASDILRESEATLQDLREARDKARALRTAGSGFALPADAPAAVARVLAGGALQPRRIAAAHEGRDPPVPTSNQPDWSYQDLAVGRCLDGLRRRPDAKIGLVLPTGAGKTRTALRVILEFLRDFRDGEKRVIWVTHQRNLRTQAQRELDKIRDSGSFGMPESMLGKLSSRIDFVMLSELEAALARGPALVVIDEAHHAAAASYRPLFESAPPVRALLLTATPNRSDGLPIGIDEIAFTITYRELEERGAIIMPEFRDFPVADFEWSEEQVNRLADYIIDNAGEEYRKVLVLAPKIDRVVEFYDRLIARLEEEAGHPLSPDAIGFVHGGGNSLGIDNESFLQLFAAKRQAILVSAQLLLEGFDDPAIDTVVITYESQSLTRLMQAAGRCVRFFPGKSRAFVVQARNDRLAYHFDQRWLYQEISDFLRPDLRTLHYGTSDERREALTEILRHHNVNPPKVERLLSELDLYPPEARIRLMLYGYPYYGDATDFERDARWGAILETPGNSSVFREAFNGFCSLGADRSDPTDFLSSIKAIQGCGAAFRQQIFELLTASYFARAQIYGPEEGLGDARPTPAHGPTTWLRYIDLTYLPAIPSALADFLSDCHNRIEIETTYLNGAGRFELAVKVPLPLDGCEAHLLDPNAAISLQTTLQTARRGVRSAAPADQVSVLTGAIFGLGDSSLPIRLAVRLEHLLDPELAKQRLLTLPKSNTQGNDK